MSLNTKFIKLGLVALPRLGRIIRHEQHRLLLSILANQ